MDDIGIGSIFTGLEIYCGLSLLFTSIGSFGLYKLLAAENNWGAKMVSATAFILSLVFGIGGIIFGLYFNVLLVFLLAMFAYAVFGLITCLTHRRTS